MAEVKIVPKISCDNCGLVIDKQAVESFRNNSLSDEYRKPRDWGSCRIEGTRDADAYGNKERLDFTDLCPECAAILINNGAKALARARGEDAGPQPAGWFVKDFSDGFIFFDDETKAREEAAATGALLLVAYKERR